MLNINLILSGGGARSVAHLGVVKALLESGIVINSISGVSGGAVAGAFISKGMTPDEILEVALENANFSIRRPPFSLSLFSQHRMEKIFAKYFPDNSFSSLHIPLLVSASNINEGRTDYFSSGELIAPLEATCALPVLFTPVTLNGYQYLDGGLLNNLPVEPFLKDETLRIGVHVNPLSTEMNLMRTYKIVERSMELVIYKSIRSRKQYCNLFIEPPELTAFTVYDFNRARDIFTMGYEYAKPHVEKFLEGESESKKAV